MALWKVLAPSDFQAAATCVPLPIDHLSVVSSSSTSQLLFSSIRLLTTTSPTADKYIRRGYLQTPNSTHTNHYSHININQTNDQIATATSNAHLQNRTKLQYISTPTVPSHITKNERPKPRRVCRPPSTCPHVIVSSPNPPLRPSEAWSTNAPQ